MVQSVVEPPAVVDLIPDPNLAAAVRETLGLTATTPLTAEVLQNLRTLVALARQILDLTGREESKSGCAFQQTIMECMLYSYSVNLTPHISR